MLGKSAWMDGGAGLDSMIFLRSDNLDFEKYSDSGLWFPYI